MTSAFLGGDCVGRTIDGRFTLLRWLGGTEQSSVFLTELEADPAQKAAIKLSPANAADADTRTAQWETARTLSHPHLMRVFHAGRCEVDSVDLLYVVTEYAEEVLSDILRERPLTPAETREMLAPVLDALSSLHGRKLVHGHLKPSNITVVEEQLKLSTDRLHTTGEPGRSAAWSGKYDAPEAALERMAPAADMWSLGVVVVEALTRKRPQWDRFSGGDPVVPASIPPPLFGIAQECLRVDPARRATLSGVTDSLQAAPAAQPAARISAPVPSRAQSSRTPPTRARLMIAGAVLLVGAIIAALVLDSHHRPPPPAALQTPATQSQTPVPESPDSSRQPHHGSVAKGAVVSQAIPDVPQHILDTIQGHIRVSIAVQVDSNGNIASATLDSPGPSRYFANRALQTARDWKFTPARMGGHAVASQWTLQFHFAQEGTTVTPTETSP